MTSPLWLAVSPQSLYGGLTQIASGSWANVGLYAVIFVGPTLVGNANPSALCSSKKRWPNMLYKRWPNMLYKHWPNMLYKRWPNMLYKRWPNMLGKRWFSVSKWKLLTMFFLYFNSFSQLFTCYSPCDLSVFLDRQSLKYNSDSRSHLNDYKINSTYRIPYLVNLIHLQS